MTTLKDKVQEVFVEPGCAKNTAKSAADRKKGCSKQLTPGAAAGGCAFDGAMIVLQPITDAVHLIHGPIACLGNSWDNRHAATSGPLEYRRGYTTDMSELDVVYGGEKKLWKAIVDIVESRDPPAIFVYQTCVPAMIGDDVVKVCKVASEKYARPVVPVNAPGFVGTKNLGNKLAGETLLDYVIGTQEPEETTPYDINLIAEFNLCGEIWQIKRLLDRCGIRILAGITGDAKYSDVASAHRAKVNMLFCGQALVNVARKMEERWGIPYFEGSFYGVHDTSDSLRELGRLLIQQGAPADLADRIDAVIAEEEALCRAKLETYRPKLEGKRVLLNTGGHKSWSIASALMDVGMQVVSSGVKKTTENDKEKLKKLLGDDAHTFDNMPPREMYRKLKESEADIMLSGARTQFIALKAKVPWLDVNQEKNYAYAAYDGLVTLVDELDKTMNNPVWAQVRAAAPWEARR